MTSIVLATLFASAFAAGDTTDYLILNHGRTAGAMKVVAAGDSVTVQFDYQDRQRGPHTFTRYQFATDGSVKRIEVGGMSTGVVSGSPLSEWFRVNGDSARWFSGDDSGATRLSNAPLYQLQSSTPYDDGILARTLLRRPNHSAALLPAGTIHADVVGDTTVVVNGTSQKLRLVALDAGGFGPSVVWLDANDAVFASNAGWFITIRKGAESALPALRAFENVFHERRSAALATKLTPPAPSNLVIRNGDVFDSERGTIMPHTTVVVRGDRIVAVGPDATTTVPRGATVIDATGKTVMPGLWDMHGHLFKSAETELGAMSLAAGVTTVRDLASDLEDAISQRARADQGTLLAPRAVLAGFIEGPGFWAGPSAVLVRTEDEARAWVARYDSLGYKQIKLYNLVHPDLVPAIAAEAHKRGMRLSGHVPRGLTVPSAVTLGFDEINHIAFLVETFYQDSLYVPKMRAYSQVAAGIVPTFDVNAPQVTALIEFLRAHGTVIDPTLGAFHSGTPLPDGSHPVLGEAVAWLPLVERRAYLSSGSSSPESVARARAGDANYAQLVKRLYDAGVTIVPGTDNATGLPLQGELEIYERAGIPAPAVLQMATIVPARVMKQDKDYGSITVGKVADIVIVDGKPAEHIRDVRHAVQVVRAGRVYRTKDLFAAVRITPKW
ncbi:MAG: amidohydrolase family protein [bacterium]